MKFGLIHRRSHLKKIRAGFPKTSQPVDTRGSGPTLNQAVELDLFGYYRVGDSIVDELQGIEIYPGDGGDQSWECSFSGGFSGVLDSISERAESDNGHRPSDLAIELELEWTSDKRCPDHFLRSTQRSFVCPRIKSLPLLRAIGLQ